MRKNNKNNTESGQGSTGKTPKETLDKALFRRLIKVIHADNNYLNPEFSRERLVSIVHVPKNKFAPLFKTHAGVAFKTYINNLRLDYAVVQMKAHRDYTVEALAKDCGIPVLQTFHRLFLRRYGQSPAVYRKNLK